MEDKVMAGIQKLVIAQPGDLIRTVHFPQAVTPTPTPAASVASVVAQPAVVAAAPAALAGPVAAAATVVQMGAATNAAAQGT